MIDCLVVGAGHCGLMSAYLLARAGLTYRVVDESGRIGDVWRKRPRGLRLFTSRRLCRLADLQMNGDPDGFPSGLEFADHLERFAREKSLPVSLGTRVARLSRVAGGFAAELENGGVVLSRTVINATGSNQRPVVPAFAGRLGSSVRQVIAPQYRDASDFPAGSRIAVIGDGASGRQIAQELAGQHQVLLARGRIRKLVPNVVLGRDVVWWLSRIGILFVGTQTRVARIMRKRDPVPLATANDKRLAAAGVNLKARAVDASERQVAFSDGSREAVDAVIWCGGYRENVDWMDLPTIDAETSFFGSRGLTSEDGFYVVGRKWLTCRASELILGAERDAAMVVGYVVEYLREISGYPAVNVRRSSAARSAARRHAISPPARRKVP
jgi:putative flavoprotein involved in K+ transport